MKLLSVIVSYFPNFQDLIKGINSIINDVDQIIIWENTPLNEVNYNKNQLLEQYPKIVFLREKDNVGIGRALNQAAKYALENGFTHLLTMDQDSFFEEGELLTFKKFISERSRNLNYLCKWEDFFS